MHDTWVKWALPGACQSVRQFCGYRFCPRRHLLSATSPAGQRWGHSEVSPAPSKDPVQHNVPDGLVHLKKKVEPILVNLGGLREYINSTNGCIAVCSIAKLPPTRLFRDQRKAGRAEIPFVDMRKEKEQKKERCSNLTGCGEEIGWLPLAVHQNKNSTICCIITFWGHPSDVNQTWDRFAFFICAANGGLRTIHNKTDKLNFKRNCSVGQSVGQ